MICGYPKAARHGKKLFDEWRLHGANEAMLSRANFIFPQEHFLAVLQRNEEIQVWIFEPFPVGLGLVWNGGIIKIGLIRGVEGKAKAVHDGFHFQIHLVTNHTVLRALLALKALNYEGLCFRLFEIPPGAVAFHFDDAEGLILLHKALSAKLADVCVRAAENNVQLSSVIMPVRHSPLHKHWFWIGTRLQGGNQKILTHFPLHQLMGNDIGDFILRHEKVL